MNGPLAVLCVAVTILWAGTVTVTAYTPPAPGCCMPDQWEGTEKIATTRYSYNQDNVNPEISFVTSNTSYDAANETEVNVIKLLNADGSIQHFKILSDYKNSFRVYLNLDTGNCKYEVVTGAFPKRCIADDAELIDPQFTYGSGDDSLDVSRLEFETASWHVSKTFETNFNEDCTPILELVFTAKPNAFIQRVHQFQNIKAGISSEEVFDIPTECTTSADRGDDSDPLAELWKELKSR